jgi:large subunit ribosomal protein L24
MKKKCIYKFHVKCGDVVKLISGKEKGKVGVITKLLKNKSKIIIRDINIKYKTIKKETKNFKGSKPYLKGEKGEIKKFEFPIHTSNVVKWDE